MPLHRPYVRIDPTVFRTFRLLQPLPITVVFPTVCYCLEIRGITHAGGVRQVIARKPGCPAESAAALRIGVVANDVESTLASGVSVECPSWEETLMLRLVRFGHAEQLAGPHCRVPDRFPAWFYLDEIPL